MEEYLNEESMPHSENMQYDYVNYVEEEQNPQENSSKLRHKENAEYEYMNTLHYLTF